MNSQLSESNGRRIFNKFLCEHGKGHLSEAFDTLTELYLDVCSKINISAIKDVDDIYIKHYLDSVYPYEHFTGKVCDVGCGGGFPTIPLAIITGLPVTGIDGVGKKLTLIDTAAKVLGLNNLKSRHARAEDISKLSIRYDTVCARAVSDVEKTVKFCAPLLEHDGTLILYRTQNDEPLKSATEKQYKLSLIENTNYVLPGTDIKRRLLVYKKSL